MALNALRIRVLSDTHGLLRPEAQRFLVGADFLIHAGEIGDKAVLERLAAMAPLTAVRGNNDRQPWPRRLRAHELLRIGDIFVCVLHDRTQLCDKFARQARVVVSGHSHAPRVEQHSKTLYVNPRSCGPRRFNLPVSIAELHVCGHTVTARTVTLAT